eukprot:357033-Chlamydomonas_euryale.AAC.4
MPLQTPPSPCNPAACPPVAVSVSRHAAEAAPGAAPGHGPWRPWRRHGSIGYPSCAADSGEDVDGLEATAVAATAAAMFLQRTYSRFRLPAPPMPLVQCPVYAVSVGRLSPPAAQGQKHRPTAAAASCPEPVWTCPSKQTARAATRPRFPDSPVCAFSPRWSGPPAEPPHRALLDVEKWTYQLAMHGLQVRVERFLTSQCESFTAEIILRRLRLLRSQVPNMSVPNESHVSHRSHKCND